MGRKNKYPKRLKIVYLNGIFDMYLPLGCIYVDALQLLEIAK